MAETIKAVPDTASGQLHFVMDAAGFELFARVIDRSVPRGTDNPAQFEAAKARIEGAFLAGAVVMGWRKK